MRRLSVLAMAALTVALSTSAAWGSNQDEANRIAQALGEKFPQYNIEVAYQDGSVRLRGEIGSQQDRETILNYVQSIPKVSNVSEMFVIAPSSQAAPIATMVAPSMNNSIMPVSALQSDQVAFNMDSPAPADNSLPAPPSIIENSVSDGSNPMGTIIADDGNYTADYAPANGSYAPPQGQTMTPGQSAQPNMPNYAWPSTANYPNYAQVSYPKQYAAGAFPYVGPFYPYPQVPLGWRKVTMEWHDGYWWLDFNDGSASGPFSPLFRQPNKYR